MSETSRPSLSVVTRATQALAVMGLVAVALLAVTGWRRATTAGPQGGEGRERDFWVLCQPGFTPGERAAALRSLVAAGNREWRAANVSGLNMAGWALAGADLQGAQFLRANLAGADLTGAKLSGGSLELADLTGAKLDQAAMVEMRLLHAVLRGATLRGAVLRACRLAQIEADNADFAGADLSEADLVMARLPGAKLVGANLTGAKLESAVFQGADLALARLDGADLRDADFTDANWWAARGLTTKQLAMLKAKFPPTASAPQAWQDWLSAEFPAWQAGQYASRVTPQWAHTHWPRKFCAPHLEQGIVD